jgi:hypothetical protein
MNAGLQKNTGADADKLAPGIEGEEGEHGKSVVGQAMLTDYENSLHSLSRRTGSVNACRGCPLDPAAARDPKQLLFRFAIKRPGGRPKVPGSELRKIVIPVRFTETEADPLRAEAAQCRISVASLIVIHALQRKPPRITSPITLDTYEEIRRIGINLNQVARRANRHALGNTDLLAKLESCRRELATIVVLISSANGRTKGDE